MQLHPPQSAVSTFSASHESTALAGERSARWRRRALWAAGIGLLLALLVLTPPLININRYRGRIAQAMSASLGRPVHLDNVSMHLLPVPGFTLQNFIVSENAAFGAEPTLRANSVEATLRLSSLWRRPLEFSRIYLNEPSVNLVRTADGRWNLGDVLLHASHVETAPTGQRRAGPAPRFPYVEATGGRINVKYGAEKLPFSLTDADFALWLPSPQQWRMRLEAQPARTDTNITDPGRIRLEGELRRAATADQVPVRFTGSWHDVPLGEATHILAGEDLNWRGTLNWDATLEGTLGDARLMTKLSLGGLRRAEFFPARTLDLQLTCSSGFAVHPATLRNTRCTLPDDAPEPLTLQAAALPLDSLRSGAVAIDGAGIPAHWALLWAGLFSPRVPPNQHPNSTLTVHLTHSPDDGQVALLPTAEISHRKKPGALPAPPRTGWDGSVALHLPTPSTTGVKSDARTNTLLWTVVPGTVQDTRMLQLSPTAVTSPEGSTLTLAGTISPGGYSVTVSGNASPALLVEPARYLPELGDGISEALPEGVADGSPARVDFTCSRSWSGPQNCTRPDAAAGHTLRR